MRKWCAVELKNDEIDHVEEYAKLRKTLAYGTYARFQDLAAEYLAKYTNY